MMTAPAQQSATPVAAEIEDQGIHWHSDLRAAHRLAVEQQRPLLVVVGAKWCGPCRRLDTETFRHPELSQYINTYFVACHLDFDDDQEIVQLLEVEAVPTSVVLSPQAELLGKFTGFSEPVPYYHSLYQAQEELIRLDAQRAVQPAASTAP
jgi:thioredoxin-like negative regulator of GroEL